MKTFLFVFLTVLFLFIPTQITSAASNFSLVNGVLDQTSEEYTMLQEFLYNMPIASNFEEGQNKYTLSGEGTLQGTTEYANNGSTGTDTAEGAVIGQFDPVTGMYSGNFTYEQHFYGTFDDGTGTYHSLVFSLFGEFTGVSNAGDTSVKLTISGTKMVSHIGQPVTESSFSFNVFYAVSGALPMEETEMPGFEETAQEETEEVPQISPTLHTMEDSGARFSDLSGQVEVLIPTGYDDKGKAVYDEEAWTFAKLDMPLPADARIRTSERSSVILSFADMTTFVMKPDSEIALLKPEAGPGQIRLLAGELWSQVKKIATEGSMDIEMSQAVAGIKGTTFVLEENGLISTLKVIEGTVQFTSRVTGETVIVEGGETVYASGEGLGAVGDFNVQAETAQWAEYGVELPSQRFPRWALFVICGGVLMIGTVIALVIIIAVVSSRKKRKPVMVAQRTYPPGKYRPPAPRR